MVPSTPWTLVPGINSYQPPTNAVCGHQHDGAGNLACALAHTPYGDIPGKAKDGTCWYPYGGKEHTTTTFSWLVLPGGSHLDQAHGNFIPQKAIPGGQQTEGGGTHYFAVAVTPHGNIPGKAKVGTCWYSYGGKEHTSSNFLWVCSN